jgi:hypothetical protein
VPAIQLILSECQKRRKQGYIVDTRPATVRPTFTASRTITTTTRVTTSKPAETVFLSSDSSAGNYLPNPDQHECGISPSA